MMKSNLPLLIACLLSLSALAQERPTLLVLGSAHLNNPGNDVVNNEIEDILTPQRQREIADVVDQLAAFDPTHIVIEFPAARQAALDERYRAYLAGEYALSRRESDQFGLRLAKRLGHGTVYAADWNGNPPGDETDYNWYAWAQANRPDALNALVTRLGESSITLGTQSVGTWLKQLNAPGALADAHRVYFEIAGFGSTEKQHGASWVGSWYGRNLRIFNRLSAIADTPDARLLVIYGSGHAYLLRQFARESGRFRLVDVDAVL